MPETLPCTGTSAHTSSWEWYGIPSFDLSPLSRDPQFFTTQSFMPFSMHLLLTRFRQTGFMPLIAALAAFTAEVMERHPSGMSSGDANASESFMRSLARLADMPNSARQRADHSGRPMSALMRVAARPLPTCHALIADILPATAALAACLSMLLMWERTDLIFSESERTLVFAVFMP